MDGVAPLQPAASDRTARAVAGAGVALLVAGISARKLGDFDLPLHLATGRAFLEHGRLLGADDFSYLHGTVRYVEVVSATLFYGVLRLAGPLGLQMVGGLAAGGVAALLWARMRRLGPVAFVATALAVAAMSSFLVVRSAELSFVLLAAVLLALDAHRRAPQTSRGRRALVAFVALSLVWANVHGSVPIGVGIGALYLAHRVAARMRRSGRLAARLLPARDGTDLRATATAVALATVAACVNPGGPAVLLGPLRFGGTVAGLSGYTEWARPTLAFFGDREPFAAALIVAAVLALALGRDADTGSRVPSLYDGLLLVLGVGCAASAVRLLPVAAILLAPWLAQRVAAQVRAGGIVGIACAASRALAPARVLASSAPPLGVGLDADHLPVRAAAWSQGHDVEGPLWNPSPFGGTLVFLLYPRTRVLMDGRQGMTYAPSDVAAVEASEHDPSVFAQLARRLDLQWAVTRAFEGTAYGAPLAASPDWAMVFLDDTAAVYVRRGGTNGRLVRDGYRRLRHLSAPAEVLSLALRPGSAAADLAHDGALARAQAPRSARAAFLDACGALAVRGGARFDAAAERLAGLLPGSPAIAVLQRAWPHDERGAP